MSLYSLVSSLAGLVGVCSLLLVAYQVLPSYLAAVIITLYLGGVMILVGYVSSLTPNTFIPFRNPFTTFSILLISFFVLKEKNSAETNSSWAPQDTPFNFLFTEYGYGMLFGLLLMLLLVLVMMTLSKVPAKGPFRRIM